MGGNHPISASSFDHLEPFWTSHLYSATTPGDVKKIRWLHQTSFPDIHLKCSLPLKWPCVLCCLEKKNFVKLPPAPSPVCCKRPSPKGIQGSQYIVRKTPQGIEMITPEMLPKNMTTLMNQAASSWKTLEADEPHRNQTPSDGARGVQLGSATSTPYSFNLRIKGLGTAKSFNFLSQLQAGNSSNTDIISHINTSHHSQRATMHY